MSYKVKIDIFEGPFDLLVYLIEHAQMSIYDIQVSEITKQYLKYIESMKMQDVTVAGEFMVLAAALIEMKSKMLLPRPKDEDGGSHQEDPRTELVERLLEYKRFKAAAEMLAGQEELQQKIFAKPQEDLAPFTKEADEYLNLELSQFVKAFQMFLIKKQRLEEIKKTYERVERQRMTVETRIQQIRSFFYSRERVGFKELLEGERTVYNVVLTFMSVLELLKQNAIEAAQEGNYGEITLRLADPKEARQGREGGERGDETEKLPHLDESDLESPPGINPQLAGAEAVQSARPPAAQPEEYEPNMEPRPEPETGFTGTAPPQID